MKKLTKLIISLGLWSLLALFVWSCGDTSPTGDVDNDHDIRLVYAHHESDNLVHGYAEILRNGDPFNLASVSAFNDIDTLPAALLIRVDNEGRYADNFSIRQLDTSRYIRTEINSAIDQFNFTRVLHLPDTFSFEAPGQPGNIVRSTDGTVPLNWTASRLANGYFVVVEPADTANHANGYVEFVGSQATSVSVPISAFHDLDGFREGVYHVWVVAYQRNPVSLPGLPFALPDGFSDNVNSPGVSGRYGSMYIPTKLILQAEAIG
jgi:hypothetical protein